MSLFSAEGVLRLCEIVTIVAGLLAVAALVGQAVANKVVGDRKAVEMLTLQKDLADAKTRQADAERKLLDVQNRLAWRMFDEYKFREVLNSGAKGKAEIVYLKDDDEAYSLAFEIWHSLAATKWEAEQPVPGKGTDSTSFSLREAGMVASDKPSLSVLVGDRLAAKPYSDDTSTSTLMKAFEAAGFAPLHAIPHEGIRPPAGVIRIVVGSRL